MARVTLSPAIKTAISKLAPKEKDKLLFRLIALKPELAAQLEYLLLEGGETQEERRQDIELKIRNELGPSASTDLYGLFYTMRELSAAINTHLKTTKDKYGEVWLNFLLLQTGLHNFMNNFSTTTTPTQQDLLATYVMMRIKRTLKQMLALEQDLHLDFKRMRNEIGELLAQNSFFLEKAAEAQISLDWLNTSDATPDLSIEPIKVSLKTQLKPKRKSWRKW